MLQAIKTTYYGPTNRLPARIKASAHAGVEWFIYDPARPPQKNHQLAAEGFAHGRQWLEKHKLVGGDLDGNSYCWVLIEK